MPDTLLRSDLNSTSRDYSLRKRVTRRSRFIIKSVKRLKRRWSLSTEIEVK